MDTPLESGKIMLQFLPFTVGSVDSQRRSHMFNTRHTWVAGAVAMAVSGVAQGAVATFEGGADPAFTYSGVNFTPTPIAAGSGYDNVAAATGSTWVAFNPGATSPSSFFIGGPSTAMFFLNSFVIAGAWGSQTLLVEGLNDGSVLFSASHFVTTAASVFSAGWGGIDELRISIGSDHIPDGSLGGSGQHWALDNLCYNERTCPSISAPVPEPETYAMLAAGLGLLGFAARRRKQKELEAV